MLQESVRAMTADERSSLERAMRPQPASGLRYRLRAIDPEAKWQGAIGALVLVVAFATIGRVSGGITAALAGGGLFGLYQLYAAVASNARMRRRRAQHEPQRVRELARVLRDGRVAVKRVRAVSVIEIEPFEDEGAGYIFDLGDGRVLFLKGQDYSPPDDEAPWPNTEFELVRTVAGGRLLDLTCHGSALPPVRVIRAGECDPQAAWEAREEVLEMSLDEAVQTILRKP